MPFMQVQITERLPWIEIDSSGGSWVVMKSILNKVEKAAIADESKWQETFEQYVEGSHRILDIEEKIGYGVRTSAPGYMDATEWEVYEKAEEAVERGKELADELYEGEEDEEEYQEFIKVLDDWLIEEDGEMPCSAMLSI